MVLTPPSCSFFISVTYIYNNYYNNSSSIVIVIVIVVVVVVVVVLTYIDPNTLQIIN